MADGYESEVEIAHLVRGKGKADLLPVVGNARPRTDARYPLTAKPVDNDLVGGVRHLRQLLRCPRTTSGIRAHPPAPPKPLYRPTGTGHVTPCADLLIS